MVSSITYPNDAYWVEFDLVDGDLDFVYNLLLEREVPLTTAEMATEIVEHRIERFEQEAGQENEKEYDAYLPAETYEIGKELKFPALGNMVGAVIGKRQGDNPELGLFEVIQVKLMGVKEKREFATGLADHFLNQPPEPEIEMDEENIVETIMTSHRDVIESRLEGALNRAEDIILIAGRWFPKALLADIHEGHLNLAEAVLDVSNGGPLPTSDLLEHIEVQSGVDPLLMAFSLDYALQEDERFDEVGPAGQVLWYLKRLEPPEVLHTPPRLESKSPLVDRSLLTDDLLALEKSIDDELIPLEKTESLDEVTISLLFPHWRVGALPLSSRLRPLFPTAYEAPRIRFNLIDGHSGEGFPGWVVRNRGYIFGLDDWYQRYEVPAGGLVKVRRGEQPGEVIVETVDRTRRNDWVRTVTLDEEGKIGFTMLKRPVGTAYDDLMVVGLVDPVVFEEAWIRSQQREMPVSQLVAFVFRELAKLTPQSAVHAQSLYSGVNVVQRLSPATVFAELAVQPYYVHVGDLYWRFELSAWSQS